MADIFTLVHVVNQFDKEFSGNMDCYHANDTGRVVIINGRRMTVRVIMPDATSCIFSGRNLEQTINGGYSCYQGGALIEQGSWRAQRSS